MNTDPGVAWQALGNVSSLQPGFAEERAALAAINTFRTSGSGYFLEQATRPQTIGYTLLDSPVALDRESLILILCVFLAGAARSSSRSTLRSGSSSARNLVDTRPRVRTRSDQFVSSGLCLSDVHLGPGHPEVVHPCGSQRGSQGRRTTTQAARSLEGLFAQRVSLPVRR